MAYRYIYREDMNFVEGMEHKLVALPDANHVSYVSSWEDIDGLMKRKFSELYAKYTKPAILLSGGMDSAVVASYLRPGAVAYTFSSKETNVFDADIVRAKKYCETLQLEHRLVDISFDDYKRLTPELMKRKGAPIHSIEPQIYKAALQAKQEGADVLLIGDAADYIFGGMDKLLSKDWTFSEFIARYYTLDPELVLAHPVDVSSLLAEYLQGGVINIEAVLNGAALVESLGSYDNAITLAGIPYMDPYEDMRMKEPLDIARVRNGESKYLIRKLYNMRYKGFEVPEKIPMPRPVDFIFEQWEGPVRAEFRKDIPMHTLTGNQKWQLWCAELFLNIFD